MIYLSEPPFFALEWCRKLGIRPDTLEFMQGGINNTVLRCGSKDSLFVLKSYRDNQARKHNRFKAEKEFLDYAQLVAPEFVPKLIHVDYDSKSIVLQYLEGDRFESTRSLSQEDIKRAADFLRNLNVDSVLAKARVEGNAAEGFLRITDHLQNIEERIAKMDVKHVYKNLQEQAIRVVSNLKQQHGRLQDRTISLIADGQCEDAIDENKRCVSPGDFGFHNAVRTPEGVKFFDFEFAGWDDPTKVVADFDLQPRVPTTSEVQVLRNGLYNWDNSLTLRYRLLYPVLQLKWACIMLNMLNPARWAQMATVSENHVKDAICHARIYCERSFLRI